MTYDDEVVAEQWSRFLRSCLERGSECTRE